jgi:hypothetical protein
MQTHSKYLVPLTTSHYLQHSQIIIMTAVQLYIIEMWVVSGTLYKGDTTQQQQQQQRQKQQQR